jgi:hypothetical protein
MKIVRIAILVLVFLISSWFLTSFMCDSIKISSANRATGIAASGGAHVNVYDSITQASVVDNSTINVVATKNMGNVFLKFTFPLTINIISLALIFKK